jgi:hypothetical protein
MIQFLVNRLQTNLKQFVTLSALFLLVGCSSVSTLKPAEPFREIVKIVTAPPFDQPALWTNGDLTLMAWPGEPAAPGIRLINVEQANTGETGQSSAKVMPLGRVPYRVSLYAAESGFYHLLWLDQTLPNETQLAGSMISAEGEVMRDPGVLSKRPTAQYAAVPNAEGDLHILWVASDNDHSLFIQMLDRKGRIQQAIHLAKNASQPAAAFDLNGDLHLAWLESAPSRVWTIHYTVLPAGKLPFDDTITSTLLGVITLENGQLLNSFTLGVDASHVYCLWNTSKIEQTASVPDSQIAGLTFPIRDNNAVTRLAFDKLADVNLRNPTVSSRTLPSLTIGLTASYWRDNTWRDVSAALVITPQGIGDLHPVYDPGAQRGLIGKVALDVDRNGVLYMGWSALQGNGSADVYFGSTR